MEEERCLDRALKQCKQVEHTLRLSIVQVKLLNRRLQLPQTPIDALSSPSTRWPASPLAISSISSRKCSSDVRLQPRFLVVQQSPAPLTCALLSPSSPPPPQVCSSSPVLSVRCSTSSPECRRHPTQLLLADAPHVYRPLNSILQHSNEINVQLIKIRRNCEGILLRIECLVRAYCGRKYLADGGWQPAPMRRRWTVATVSTGPVWRTGSRDDWPERRRATKRYSEPALGYNGDCAETATSTQME